MEPETTTAPPDRGLPSNEVGSHPTDPMLPTEDLGLADPRRARALARSAWSEYAVFWGATSANRHTLDALLRIAREGVERPAVPPLPFEES